MIAAATDWFALVAAEPVENSERISWSTVRDGQTIYVYAIPVAVWKTEALRSGQVGEQVVGLVPVTTGGDGLIGELVDARELYGFLGYNLRAFRPSEKQWDLAHEILKESGSATEKLNKEAAKEGRLERLAE